ncbi:hypothetical protein QBC99_005757 [Beijerinckia sp. GAS462]|nr:hypothetical protein [Beijerinckia sp. GAS462]
MKSILISTTADIRTSAISAISCKLLHWSASSCQSRPSSPLTPPQTPPAIERHRPPAISARLSSSSTICARISATASSTRPASQGPMRSSWWSCQPARPAWFSNRLTMRLVCATSKRTCSARILLPESSPSARESRPTDGSPRASASCQTLPGLLNPQATFVRWPLDPRSAATRLSGMTPRCWTILQRPSFSQNLGVIPDALKARSGNQGRVVGPIDSFRDSMSHTNHSTAD